MDISMKRFSSVSSHFEFCNSDISNTLLHGCVCNAYSFLLEEIGMHPAPVSFRVTKKVTRKLFTSEIKSK